MKEEIKFDDFMRLDLRVGEVVECSEPDWSHKLLQLAVDFGEEIGKRTIFSGIKGVYEPDELVGKKGVFVVNLEPKKMGEAESQGMMLMSDTEEKPVPIEVSEDIPNGTIVR